MLLGYTHLEFDNVFISHYVSQLNCQLFLNLSLSSYFPRVESVMLGYYRLSQETDNETKVFVVVSKKKEEVSVVTCFMVCV